MTEESYESFFLGLAQKRIIGHNPESVLKRFLLYDPDFLLDWSRFDLDINNYCFLLSRYETNIPWVNGADKLEHPCSFLIVRATNNTQPDIDDAMEIAYGKAIKFWAKLRNIQEENDFLFGTVKIGSAPFQIQKVKNLPDQAAGVDVIFSLSEAISYYKFLQDDEWI